VANRFGHTGASLKPHFIGKIAFTVFVKLPANPKGHPSPIGKAVEGDETMAKWMGRQWLAAATMAVGVSGPAQAACWQGKAVEAAQIRDFSTMMMVATLRCRGLGVDFSSDYNRFIREKRTALIAVNDELRAQFNKDLGGRAALDAMDRFVTRIANGYGDGAGAQDCAAFSAMAQEATATSADRAGLLILARRAGSDPVLPGGRCAPSNQIAAIGD
jgi:hypothetical protein